MDRQDYGDNNAACTLRTRAGGGSSSPIWKREVVSSSSTTRRSFINEYHVDGFRFDEVTVIDRYGGWEFLQNLTDTLRSETRRAIDRGVLGGSIGRVALEIDAGAGFDAVSFQSRRRSAVRWVSRRRQDARVTGYRGRDSIQSTAAHGGRSTTGKQDVVRGEQRHDRQPASGAG